MQPCRCAVTFLMLAGLWATSVTGQTAPATTPSETDARTSWTFDTYTPGPCSATGARHGGCNPGDLVRIAVTTIASALVQPWHITFVPGTGDVLVTELPGRLRIIRNGVLDAAPVPGWPVASIPSRSLHSVVLHPRFAENRTVDLTYVKGKDAQTRTPTTTAVARARFDGRALSAVEQIYTGDRFPLWKGHFFIGALGGQQLQRVAFNQPLPQTERRESLLVPLDARVRDVRQAPAP